MSVAYGYEPVPQPQAGTTYVSTGQGTVLRPTARVRPSRCASGVLFGFSVVAIVLAFVCFLLNVIPLGKGVRLYYFATNGGQGYSPDDITYDLPTDLPTVTTGSSNFFPGVWFGLLELVAAVLAAVFACYARGPGRTLLCGCSSGLCGVGTLLATFFGLLVPTAIAANVLSLITLFKIWDLGSCLSFAGDCVCEELKITNADCQYVNETLPIYYLAMAFCCGALVVVNIVIASLFCGVLCCCTTPVAVDDEQQHVSVVVQPTPVVSNPAYVQHTDYVPAPVYTRDEQSMPG